MGSWLMPSTDPVPAALLQAVGGHPLLARLLIARGLIEPSSAQAFLDPDLYHPASPYVLPGMIDAVRLLRGAISAGQRIRIWGDLDADGMTATAVLYEALVAGGAKVDFGLPMNSQGHGLPLEAVKEALADGIGLVVTCDTGVTDTESVRYAVEQGLQVVITDHHDMPEELPPAGAIVNSKLLSVDHPAATLSGVGVAYMVAGALLDDPTHAATRAAMLDLVALGLVVDKVSEVGDVRYLIQRGIQQMQRQPRVGLQALAELSRVDLAHADERDIQFQLGPRINVAGRLGSAQHFLELLLTDDKARAVELAGALEALNLDRRAHTEALTEQIEHRLAQDPELLRQPAIMLQGDDWPAGVLGSVAGDLARRYERPAVLIAHHSGGDSTASARSVEGIDIHQAIVSQAPLLRRQGGHPMAAGFGVAREHVDQVVQGMQRFLASVQPEQLETRPMPLAAALDWAAISLPLAEQVARLRPFGPGNPPPTFLLQQARVERIEPLGREASASPHQRLFLSDGGERQLAIIWFRAGELPAAGESIDVAFQMDVSSWQGRTRLDLQLLDWRSATGRQIGEQLLLSGQEVIDWRQRQDGTDLVGKLSEQYGDRLWIWAEGQAESVLGSETRAERADRPCTALAIATLPASPAVLRDVLANGMPQVVYLLPVADAAALSIGQVLRTAAGLARAAIAYHGGVLDYARAEQATGLPAYVLELATELLVVRGALGLDHGRLVVPKQNAVGAQDASFSTQLAQRLNQELREVAAYRRAYASLSAALLLAHN